MISTRRTMIFGELHNDPANIRILAKLMPRLKVLGFDDFYDESPPGYIMAVKGKLEEVLERYYNFVPALYQKIMDSLQFQLNNTAYSTALKYGQLNSNVLEVHQNNIKKFIEELNVGQKTVDDLVPFANKLKQYITDLSKNDEASIIYDHFRLFNATLDEAILLSAEISFLQGLQKNNITHHSIDDKARIPQDDPDMITDSDEMIEIAKSKLSISNKTMTNAYLNATKAVFGKIGGKHTQGIQDEILSKLSKEEALNKFLFFFIYSNDEGAIYCNKLANKNLPLGLIGIDVRNISDDEVVDLIIDKMMEKQNSNCFESISQLKRIDRSTNNASNTGNSFHRLFDVTNPND